MLFPSRLNRYVSIIGRYRSSVTNVAQDGLREIDKVQQEPQPCPVSQKSTETIASGTENRRKRKVDEIADSQDEDESDEEFGWLEGDDSHLLEGDD